MNGPPGILAEIHADLVAGIVIIAAAMCLLLGLVFWSRRIINRIARRGFGSAREIMKDLRDA